MKLKVMHPSVPEEFKPALFENGKQVPFPKPSKAGTLRCKVCPLASDDAWTHGQNRTLFRDLGASLFKL